MTSNPGNSALQSSRPGVPWRRDEVDSPCVRICLIHPDSGFCIGCQRSVAEIAGWSRMSADERRAILEQIPERAKECRPRRKGMRQRRKGGNSSRSGNCR